MLKKLTTTMIAISFSIGSLGCTAALKNLAGEVKDTVKEAKNAQKSEAKESTDSSSGETSSESTSATEKDTSVKNWKPFTSEKYNFQMLIPEGLELKTFSVDGFKEGTGWAGLNGKLGVVTMWGIAKMGKEEPFEAIQKFGAEVSGIPEANWKVIDEGAADGFNKYRFAKASNGTDMVYAGYGTGKGNSYLIFVKSTEAEVTKNQKDYDLFAASVKLVD